MSRPVCTIVGVGPGLGVALARRFSQGGYDIGAVARGESVVAGLSNELAANGRVCVASADAGDELALARALAQVETSLGPISVLIYNAAAYSDGKPTELIPDGLRHDLATNVVGALIALRSVVPSMRRAHAGTIVFTGGGAALYPRADYASLAITKSAMRNLAIATHDELAGENIFATTVTIQGTIGSRDTFAPSAIAERYWQIVNSQKADWKPEYPYTG